MAQSLSRKLTSVPEDTISYGSTAERTITPRQLRTERAIWNNVSPHQREPHAWPKIWGPLYFDTLLRGPKFMTLDPIAFDKCWERVNDRDRLFYSVENGQQRLNALYAILNNEIKTLSEREYRKHVLVKQLEPLPFSCRLEDLPSDMQEEFLDYPIPILVSEQVDPAIAAERYRRRNLVKPQTKGNNFWSYHPTKATTLATTVGSHHVWAPMWADKKRINRNYSLELSLYLIHLWLNGLPTQISQRELTFLASGRYDDSITPQISVDLLTALEHLARLFLDAPIRAKTDGLVCGQAYWYLQHASCDFERCMPGCLTPWFSESKTTTRRSQTPDNLGGFGAMWRADEQVRFWRKQGQLKRLFSQEGLVFRDAVARERVLRGAQLLALKTPEPISADVDEDSGCVTTTSDRLIL